MAKLTMTTKPEKASVNNSGDKTVGVELYLDQITKAEPFASLFTIKSEVFEAIKADMKANGFDPSKPINVWKKADGTRVLIDGYTRVRAAEELGLLRVTAYEKTFSSEAEALAYAIHTQRDRRNLSDTELLRLIELVDRPQDGFHSSLAPTGANESSLSKTAAITADAVGISARKVERARVVLSDPDEAAAVRRGDKTIHQAAEAAKAKRATPSAPSRARALPPDAQHANNEAIAEGLRIIGLLQALAQHDPNASRRKALRSVIKTLRPAFSSQDGEVAILPAARY
jgi:ParB-like chromosome segregation protein Spo0J